jgi:hypothetical protein
MRMLILFLATACVGSTSPVESSAKATPTAETRDMKRAPNKVQSPSPFAAPLSPEQLAVGTARTLVILGVSDGRDQQDPAFRVVVNTFTGLRMPVQEWWLGCQPAAEQAVGKTGERWAVSLSFSNRADADHYVMGKGLTPLAVLDDQIEPCGD